MILVGQYDSPFVRRVAIALATYGMAFEHRPWSTFADRDKVAELSPLIRVPILVLDNGEALIESGAILDHLDEVHGRERALIAASGEARRRALAVIALACGAAEKAVALFYELAFHAETAASWIDRCADQIGGALDELEEIRGATRQPFFHGETPGHADIALACALRFIGEAHPGLVDPGEVPALTAHAARCEALPVFRDHAQTFAPPKR